MKPTQLIAAVITVTGLPMLGGCAFAARSANMYRDDTQAVLATKNDAIRECYDGVLKTTPGAQGMVAITFDVETKEGKLVNVAVDAARTTAPAPVAECVTQSVNGLALSPPDARQGKGEWTYQFTAPPAGAAPPVAAPVGRPTVSVTAPAKT